MFQSTLYVVSNDSGIIFTKKKTEWVKVLLMKAQSPEFNPDPDRRRRKGLQKLASDFYTGPYTLESNNNVKICKSYTILLFLRYTQISKDMNKEISMPESKEMHIQHEMHHLL